MHRIFILKVIGFSRNTYIYVYIMEDLYTRNRATDNIPYTVCGKYPGISYKGA